MSCRSLRCAGASPPVASGSGDAGQGTKLTRIGFGGVAVATVTAAGCCSAAGQAFSQFVGFGDSTIDSGWYRNAAPNSTNPVYNADFAIAVTQGGGKATTNPGLVSS